MIPDKRKGLNRVCTWGENWKSLLFRVRKNTAYYFKLAYWWVYFLTGIHYFYASLKCFIFHINFKYICMYLSSICLFVYYMYICICAHTLKERYSRKVHQIVKLLISYALIFVKEKISKNRLRNNKKEYKKDQHFYLLITILEDQSKMSLINMFSILQFWLHSLYIPRPWIVWQNC